MPLLSGLRTIWTILVRLAIASPSLALISRKFAYCYKASKLLASILRASTRHLSHSFSASGSSLIMSESLIYHSGSFMWSSAIEAKALDICFETSLCSSFMPAAFITVMSFWNTSIPFRYI